MKNIPSCILYSPDEELTGRFTRILSQLVILHSVEEQADLEQRLAQMGDTVLLADLRAPRCLELLSEIKTTHPLTVFVVIGADRSDPMLTAEWLDPFATLNFKPDRRELQTLLRQATECFSLRQKTHVLEHELAKLKAQQVEPKAQPRTLFSTPLQNFSNAQKNFDNLEALFESVVEGLVATARVSRAGIFIQADPATAYLFQAGTRCLKTTENLSIPAGSDFIRWLEMNTHLVSRRTLENIIDPHERIMLRHMLDALGSEIILPLHASGGIKGWIFVGQRASGIPFDEVDLEDLAGLADHISTTLEKALQYEETALQKALAETLLHSIPFGIIACDETATLRWFNTSAREIMQTENEPVIGQRVESLGSQIADILRRTLGAKKQIPDSREWTDPATKRTLSSESRCLIDHGNCVGAVIMLHDITGAKLLQEKEEQLERTAFWTELAASMSHEIRNPLVAIKTFSQLLPERYDDPSFREDFSDQVVVEVDKLDQIIDKINAFATLPQPVFKALDIRKPIEHAVTHIQSEFDHEHLNIHLAADDSTLQMKGDAASLEECMYHLLKNAAENLDNKSGSRINISVKGRDPSNGHAKIFVTITDNGSGIDPSVREKLFSPFSTIKARGLGLGLPIAKRSVIDHNGQLDIDTSSGGTSITITFPALGTA